MKDNRKYRKTHPWIIFRHHLDRASHRHWLLLGEATSLCEQVAQAVLQPEDARKLHESYLIKGAQATTAIEGNTLSEKQIAAQLEGRLNLPLSQKYLQQEVDNVLKSFGEVFRDIMIGNPPDLTPDWISDANRRLLKNLEDHLENGVVPGEIRKHEVGVMRYKGAPKEDCTFLLERLCNWIEGDGWPAHTDRYEDRISTAILRAIFVHLYIAWIHPFGDGNGRTARFAEFMILAREGVPSPCAHLLSSHYNHTRAVYYRELDRSSRTNPSHGDPLGFLLYALQGFVDGLREQARIIANIQLKQAWELYVYSEFKQLSSSSAVRRRREVTLTLGREDTDVRMQDIPDMSTSLARLYMEKTSKTLSRDLNWLVKKGFLKVGENGFRARVEVMRAFQPPRAQE